MVVFRDRHAKVGADRTICQFGWATLRRSTGAQKILLYALRISAWLDYLGSDRGGNTVAYCWKQNGMTGREIKTIFWKILDVCAGRPAG